MDPVKYGIRIRIRIRKKNWIRIRSGSENVGSVPSLVFTENVDCCQRIIVKHQFLLVTRSNSKSEVAAATTIKKNKNNNFRGISAILPVRSPNYPHSIKTILL